MRFNVYLVASSSFSTIFLFKKILSSVGIEFKRSTFQTLKYVDKVVHFQLSRNVYVDFKKDFELLIFEIPLLTD